MQSLTEFFDRDTLRWALLLLFVAALFLFMPDAMAGNNNAGNTGGGTSLLPQGTLAVPGTSNTDPWYKILIYALRFGLIALLLIALVVGLGDSLFGIFRTINDARTSGEWGPALKQIMAVVIAIIFAFVIYMVADKYGIQQLENLVK